MKKAVFIFPVIMLILSNSLLFAQEENKLEQVIQEFPFTQAVYLQELKEVQQTLRSNHNESLDEIGNTVGYSIEYGFAEWFQLGAGYNYEHWNSEGIPYNSQWFEAEAMIGILNSSTQAVSFSFEAEFALKKPEVSEIEVETEPSYAPSLIYARKIWKAQLHLNAGAEFQDGESSMFYNAAAVYGPGNWHPVIEFNAVEEEKMENYLGTGLVVNGSSGWEFGAGIRKNLNKSEWNSTFFLIYEFTIGEEEE